MNILNIVRCVQLCNHMSAPGSDQVHMGRSDDRSDLWQTELCYFTALTPTPSSKTPVPNTVLRQSRGTSDRQELRDACVAPQFPLMQTAVWTTTVVGPGAWPNWASSCCTCGIFIHISGSYWQSAQMTTAVGNQTTTWLNDHAGLVRVDLHQHFCNKTGPCSSKSTETSLLF